MSSDPGPGTREVAHRLFATEYDAASLEYADSEEERAPKYVITPTGARANRLFIVGVLTEVERVNDDVLRARVADPTGAFVVYTGQYQPDALAFLERAEPPEFVAVTGKANAFEPDDSERVFTSIRPETVAAVDAETRDRWTVGAAEHTLDRIAAFARALDDGEDADRDDGIALARDHYGTTPAYLAALRETAIEAARLVAGEADAVSTPAFAPGEDDGREVAISELQGDIETPGPEPEPEPSAAEPASTTEPAESAPASEAEAEPAENEAEPEPEPATSEPAEPIGEPQAAEATADEAPGDFEPTVEPEAGEPDEPDETEDHEPGGVAEKKPEEGLYELDEAERAEVEEEFGTEFSTGGEVDQPGEADIDVPDAEDLADLTGEESEAEPADTVASGADTDGEPEEESEEATDIDIEDRAMEAMRDLADGDGADRGAVIERVADEHGVDPGAVDDAIESALMSGRCYEPQDDVLKPI